MELVIGAALGAGFGELVVRVRNIFNVIINMKSTSKEIKEKILHLKPNIDHMLKLLSDSDGHREPQLTDFQSQLQKGLHLVKGVEKFGKFDLYAKYRYGKKILKLEKNIHDFMISSVAKVMLDMQKLYVDFKGYNERFERLEEMGRYIIYKLDRFEGRGGIVKSTLALGRSSPTINKGNHIENGAHESYYKGNRGLEENVQNLEEEIVLGAKSFHDGRSVTLNSRKTIVLKVVNMNCCEGCKEKVMKQLLKIYGVDDVDVDAELLKVTVTTTSEVDVAFLIHTLKKSGKHAELWPT